MSRAEDSLLIALIRISHTRIIIEIVLVLRSCLPKYYQHHVFDRIILENEKSASSLNYILL